MRFRLVALVMPMFFAANVIAEEAKKDSQMMIHDGHFENNNSGLTGKESFLLITDSGTFDKTFGVAAFGVGPTKKQQWVKPELFEKRVVVAVIKRGNSVPTYSKVETKIEDETLKVTYRLVEGRPSTAQFASPLILSLPKGKFKKVEFIENDKKVGTAE